MEKFDPTLKHDEIKIFNQISDLFSEKGIKFRKTDQLFKFEANVDERVIDCMLTCDMNRSLLTFSAFLQPQIPHSKVSECVELMARFNEKIWYGAFEFSFEYRVISHVTTLPIDNASISYEQLERLCFNNLLNVHYFQIGFEKLLEINSKPEEIFREVITDYQL